MCIFHLGEFLYEGYIIKMCEQRCLHILAAQTIMCIKFSIFGCVT